MKYAQGIIGLLMGTALGGSVVAATTSPTIDATTPTGSDEQIRAIVREVIKEEPQLIMESVAGWQQKQQQAKLEESSAALKDADVREAVLQDGALAYAGNKNGTHIVAEFFDYDCPVCKMQFQIFSEMLKKDPELKVVFHEYPIFGPVSEENSRLGLAVAELYPEKYYDFHARMMEGKGHEPNNDKTYAIISDLGMDLDKVKETAKSEEVAAKLTKSRDLGQKLNIQGTPTLVVGETLIPHAAQANDLEAMFKSE